MVNKTLFLRTVLLLSLTASAFVFDGASQKVLAAKEAGANETTKDELGRVVATFPDKTEITYGEVQALMSQLPEKVLNETSPSKLFVVMLQRLVDSKVLSDAAKKAGFDQDKTVLERIDETKELLLQKVYLDSALDKLITDSILREKYDEVIKLLPKEDEYNISHILCNTEEEAKKILEELKKSSNKTDAFETLVRTKSIDGSTKAKAGNIGWVKKSDIKNDALFSAEPGQVVGQVIKLFHQGYSVFLIKGKRPAQPPVFDDTKDQIKQAITPQYSIQVLEKLRKESGLSLVGLDKQPLPLPEMPPMPKLGTDPKDQPKMPEPKDFSAVNEKALEGSMVVGTFKNGDKITLSEVRDSVSKLPPELKNAPFHQQFQPLLLRIADTKLLIESAKKDKLDTSADYLKKLEEMKKSTVQRFYLESKVGEPTQQMLKDAYQELLVMYPKDDMEISLRHIMVKTREEAMDLIQQIRKGGVSKFNELVKEKSIDPQTKDKNGDLGYLPKKELPTELADVLFKAAKATMLPEPIKLGEQGYSVMRVEDKRIVQPPALEQVKSMLVQLILKRESAKIVLKLREDSKVVMKDIKGKVIPAVSPQDLAAK